MPLFNTVSPFDVEVDKATDEMNTDENWALFLDICDRAKQSPTACKDCLRSIVRRLRHRVPVVAMQALSLLNACVKNCGRTFHLEIASREFVSECRSLISDKTHPKVAQKLKLLIKSWSENEFKSDTSLTLIPTLYNSLKTEGHSFVSDDPPVKSKVVLSKDPNVVSSQEEEEDVAKAIALSLQEADKKKSGTVTTSRTTSSAGSLYPSVSGNTALASSQIKTREPRKVRALYDFEAVEDNELTFTEGEIIGVTDDSDVNWWRGVSWRGEGLFPANFVTSDLATESTTTATAESKTAKVQSIEPSADAPTIDEEKIDNALVMIQNADPTGESGSDPVELSSLEDQCHNMSPLIDQELEGIDRQHSRLTELNSQLVESLQLYHTLMQELPAYSLSTTTTVQPTYMSLAQMYGNQQALSVGQLPSGIVAEVGSVPPGLTTQSPSTYYTQQQYSLPASYVGTSYNYTTGSFLPPAPGAATLQQQQQQQVPIYNNGVTAQHNNVMM